MVEKVYKFPILVNNIHSRAEATQIADEVIIRLRVNGDTDRSDLDFQMQIADLKGLFESLVEEEN